MTRLTIPAREVREGDRLDLGACVATYDAGQPIARTDGTSFVAVVMTDGRGVSWTAYPHPDALVEVDRPDPDAELVERIAQALAEADEDSTADDAYRQMARAALAVVRGEQ